MYLQSEVESRSCHWVSQSLSPSWDEIRSPLAVCQMSTWFTVIVSLQCRLPRLSKAKKCSLWMLKIFTFCDSLFAKSYTFLYFFWKKVAFYKSSDFLRKFTVFSGRPRKVLQSGSKQCFWVRIDRPKNSDAICCRNASLSPIVDIYSFNCHSLKLEIFCRQMSTFFIPRRKVEFTKNC